MGMLPTVVATLLADTREYMAKMDEAGAKMAEFGGIAEASGGRMNKFANTASTAVLGVGAAITAFGVDKAFQFQEGLDKLQNQAGLTADQADKLGKAIMGISNATGQSTSDLINSALAVEQAGIKGKKATDLLNTAAQAAVVTNASVADTTQAIVAAQSLQITKGMSVQDLTGKLVAGSKEFVGGLKAEEAMLSGRVGVALAAHGLQLSTVTALGAEFAKVGLPSRSIATFATALSNIENPTKTYTKNLEKARLSQNILAADLRRGDVGGMLKYIKEQAGGSAAKLQEMVNAVFGKTGGAAASDLIKNLQSFITIQKQVAGSGSGSLTKGFGEASKQLGVQMKIIEQQLVNSAAQFGLVLMPYVKDAANIVTGAMNYISTHKGAQTALGESIATAFAAALAVKASNIGIKIAEAFGVAVEAGTAATIGAAVATGVGTALIAWNLGKPSQASFNKASAEWKQNKLGGAYDIAALTLNTLGNAVLKGLFGISVSGFPILGPSSPRRNTGLPGYMGSASAPKKTTHKVTVTVRGHGTIGK